MPNPGQGQVQPPSLQPGTIIANPPAKFNPHTEDPAEAWRSFKADYKIFSKVSRLDTLDADYQKYVFLDVVGKEAREWMKTLGCDEEAHTLEALLEKIDEKCSADVSETLLDFRFWHRERDQQNGERFDEFYERVVRAARKCKFRELEDRMVRSRIVIGLLDEALQGQLLSEQLDLAQVVKKCRSFEAGRKSARVIQSAQSAAGHVIAGMGEGTQRADLPLEDNNNKTSDGISAETEACWACGRKHPRRRCPAWGQQCLKCGSEGHFARRCPATRDGLPDRRENYQRRQTGPPTSDARRERNHRRRMNPTRRANEKKVWVLQQTEDESDTEDDFRISSVSVSTIGETTGRSRWNEIVSIANHPVLVKLDTGADVSVLPMAFVNELQKKHRNLKLHKVRSRLVSYFGDSYDCGYVVHLSLSYQRIKLVEKFFVVPKKVTLTLSEDAAEALGS